MLRLPFVMLPGLIAFTLCATAAVWADEAQPAGGVDGSSIDFARDVRPIFQQHCDRCHGAQKQESNYRLDVREVAMGKADLGSAPIVPGHAQDSPLVRYVSGSDEDGIVMPPEDVAERLTAEQVDMLRAWVDQGAPWPDDLAGRQERLTTEHWSFQPLRRPPLPGLQSDWVRTPIDAFVLDELQRHRLSPSSEADRRTLVRRLYLVLLGLPPSPEDVRTFLDDTSPSAYERLVDRVLSSPRFGERWARHWLDIVRFADTHGFETNRLRTNAYPYRDYVIQSFNEDTPYDRFVREQICGDAMHADVATGFLVAGPYDLVKSPDINLTLMQRQDELADMVNTTGTTFLALTMGCARCHNHKFDPIPQRDYYAMQAVFAGVNHGERALLAPEDEATLKQLAHLRDDLALRRQQLGEYQQRARQLYDARLASDAKRPAVDPRWNEEDFAAVPARHVRFTVHATNTGSEPCIDEWEIYSTDGTNVALAACGAVAQASGTLPGYQIHKLKHINDGLSGNDHSWISDTPGKGWVEITFPETVTINRMTWGRDRQQRFADRLATDYVMEVAVEPDDWHVVSSSADRQPFSGQPALTVMLEALPESEAVAARAIVTQIADIEQRINELSATVGKAWIGTFQQPVTTHRLYRGDPMAPREQVAPDGLTLFGSLGMSVDEAEQERRIRFADWMTSQQNPLLARVIVNRLWHYHFGTGIVDTPSDFGANGARPSHPRLLDWLAQELIDHQWSLKHIHRLIVMSSVFRQESRPREEGMAADAAARWLWRFPPRRLEAEVIRDSMLCVSGVLDQRMGGPGFSVFEVQPENVHHYFPKKSWGPAEWRRMIYMTKVRQEQDAVFGNFDCPDGNQTMPKRSRSTTPLQALNLFNSQFVLQQAERLAGRIGADAGPDVSAQIDRAFELLDGREPDEDERRLAADFVARYGLEAMCRAMLNSNEFLFVF